MASAKSRIPSIPIRYAIPFLFVVLIVTTVGSTGWLAFCSGQEAVNDLATQLSGEITARIEEHTLSYLDLSHLYHQINAAAIHADNLDVADFTEMRRYLWHQAREVDPIAFSYFGTEQGTIIGVEQRTDGSMALWMVDEESLPQLNIFLLDDALEPVELLDSIDSFDPRTRPWYHAAVARGAPTWSTVYPDISRPILVITSVTPIYDDADMLLGVFAVDIDLSEISNFLRSLTISEHGQAFIVEHSGEIVASSSEEPPYVMVDDEPVRISAADSTEPLIQATAQHLAERFGNLQSIENALHFTFSFEGERQFVQVNEIRDGRGLDWLIIVVIPETDLMGPIYDNVRSTAILGVVIVSVAMALGLALGNWIIRPVFAITDAAAAVEREAFESEMLEPVAKRADEFGQLARIFQRMAHEVYERAQRLKAQVEQLRIEIDEVRRQQQVEEIVESEFFRNLESRARDIRERRDQVEGEGSDEDE